MGKVFRGVYIIYAYIIANTIGRLVYDTKYFKGRHFKGIKAMGWRWVTHGIWWQKICGYNKHVPWPVSEKLYVGDWKNIKFDPNDLQIFHTFGTYFQGWGGKIIIGKGSYIAPNVGLITSNHDLYNLDERMPGKDINLGESCWLGMNSVVLPGVTLGNHTVVGAGAVVTKCFEEGYCVIAGNPAKKIKDIERKDKNEN